MRIGIDARLTLRKRRGMGRVLLNIITHLAKLDQENQYILYLEREDKKNILPEGENFSKRVILPPNYPIWEQFSLPIVCKEDKLDILHCPANTRPILLPKEIKLIVTLHDVIYLKPFSEIPLSSSIYQNLGRIYRILCAKLLWKKINHIVTISEFSKCDIQNTLRIPPNRITVVPLGIDDFFFQKNRENCEVILKKLGIDSKFIFHLGGIAPTKNTKGAIKAYSLLVKKEEYRDLSLIIGGIPIKNNNQILQFVQHLGLKNKVKFLDYVSDKKLKCLYTKAELFLFPSLYEGFGLPPLEAMACGTPVVASNSSSIPEVVEDTVILVNPENINEIKDGMDKILEDNELRNRLIEKGKNQAKKFEWNKAVKRLLQVYRQVYENKS